MCSCFEVFVKVILFIVNFIVSLIAIGIIVIGSLLVVYSDYFPDTFGLYSIVTIIIGCIIFLVSCCGCYGALAQNKCLLITYIVFVVLLTGLNIYLAVISSSIKNTAESLVTETIDNLLNDPDLREDLHLMEYLFGCCGTSGADSYEAIEVSIPPTCCENFYNVPNINDIISNINATDADYCSKEETLEGCVPRITGFMEEIFEAATIIAIVLTLIGVIFVMLATYLLIRKKEKGGRVLAPQLSMSSPFYYGRD